MHFGINKIDIDLNNKQCFSVKFWNIHYLKYVNSEGTFYYSQKV